MPYVKTQWVNGTTPLDADNMNKIEEELETLDETVSGFDERIEDIEETVENDVVHQVNGKSGKNVSLTASDINATNSQSIQQNLERIDEEINRVEGEIPTTKQEIANIGGLVFPNGVALKELVGVDAQGNQIRIQLGNKLSLSGVTSPYTLNASSGKYLHKFSLYSQYDDGRYQIQLSVTGGYINSSSSQGNANDLLTNLNNGSAWLSSSFEIDDLVEFSGLSYDQLNGNIFARCTVINNIEYQELEGQWVNINLYSLDNYTEEVIAL